MRRFTVRIVLAVVALSGGISGVASGRDSFGDDRGDGGTTSPPVEVEWGDADLSVRVAFREDLRITNSQSATSGSSARCGVLDTWFGHGEAVFQPIRPHERDDPYIYYCWYPREDDPNSVAFTTVPGFPQPYWCCTPGVPGGVLVDDWDVAAFAVSSISFEPPTPETSPATNQVVGVPTWLAVTSQLDYPSATASAGPIWATVTPVMKEVVWEFGNGESMSCSQDVATVWDPEISPGAQDSTCTHTFTNNGSGDLLNGQVTVTWDVFMVTSENGGTPELWGQIQQDSPVGFEVRELQAVIN